MGKIRVVIYIFCGIYRNISHDTCKSAVVSNNCLFGLIQYSQTDRQSYSNHRKPPSSTHPLRPRHVSIELNRDPVCTKLCINPERDRNKKKVRPFACQRGGKRCKKGQASVDNGGIKYQPLPLVETCYSHLKKAPR